ncbi:MAG TPA: hypothetical protein VK164_00685 [Flavobacterium sp.]|uniref:hypothetical protein n=1 Tax=Flavobacterium sp. TaxID=239 RepID=UPI002B4B410F|nr:hypothetical protein [Flavobacterium sp.]HLO72430.1 hypothetical protein [Flavobacterium sp.]
MKKINGEILNSFCLMDLQRYSTLVNQYFKRKWRFFFLFFLTSCSVQNQINKEEFIRFPKSLSVRFYDKLDTITTQYDNRIVTRSFIKDFSNKNDIDFSKPIHLEINQKELYLKFKDKLQKQYVLKFYGKQYNKRFVFYTNYETITFPILFMSKQMTKYSVYLSNDNEVIFEEHNVNEGMLFVFGGGHSSRFDYRFKILKDE